MKEFATEDFVLTRFSDKLDVRQLELIGSGLPASRVDAFSSLLIDHGIEDPKERQEIIAEHFGVFFPVDLLS